MAGSIFAARISTSFQGGDRITVAPEDPGGRMMTICQRELDPSNEGAPEHGVQREARD
jgi:hypothetical protein